MIGSSAFTIPAGTKIGPKAFLALNLPDGSFALNNTGGDTLRLIWPDKSELRLVSYKELAAENETYARKDDGSYAWTSVITKAGINQFIENIVAPPVTSQAQTKIKFNEIFGNPVGTDSGLEWVEVFNAGTEPVYLHNWILDDGAVEAVMGSSAYKILSPIVYPKGLAVILIPAGKFAINNTGTETLRLFNENKILIDSVTFEASKEGQSYSLLNNQWIWTDPSPNAVNTESVVEAAAPVSLVISEVYPEPETGEEEFIEIFNSGTTLVNLHGFQVTDLSTTYTFQSPEIPPNGFYALKKSESQIALNNFGQEKISLIDPKGNILSSVEYEDAPKNQSYNLMPDGTFAWSSMATPAAENQFKVAVGKSVGKVKGLTMLPRTGNAIAFSLWDCLYIWAIIWYIYIRLSKDQSYEQARTD